MIETKNNIHIWRIKDEIFSGLYKIVSFSGWASSIFLLLQWIICILSLLLSRIIGEIYLSKLYCIVTSMRLSYLKIY